MKKETNQTEEKIFQSYGQFFKNISPNSILTSSKKIVSPYFEGVEFASSSIRKIKRILSA